MNYAIILVQRWDTSDSNYKINADSIPATTELGHGQTCKMDHLVNYMNFPKGTWFNGTMVLTSEQVVPELCFNAIANTYSFGGGWSPIRTCTVTAAPFYNGSATIGGVSQDYHCIDRRDGIIVDEFDVTFDIYSVFYVTSIFVCNNPGYPNLIEVNGVHLCESNPIPVCPKPEIPPEDCPSPDGTNRQTEKLFSSTDGKFGQTYSNLEQLVCTEQAQQSQTMSEPLSQPMESLAVTSSDKWKNDYDRNFQLIDTITPITAAIQMPTGMSYVFEDNGAGGWTGTEAQRASFESIVDGQSVVTGYRLILKNDTVEEYNASGYLVSIKKRNSTGVTLSYDVSSQLETITDSFNKTITLAYDGTGRVNQVTSPDNEVFRFEYDGSGNKIKTIYPDDTPADPNDNPFKQYHYEDTNFPDYLTGITDEKGIRTDTWGYDTSGRLVSESHPGGADDKTYSFNPDGTTTETNALGKETIYHFEVYDSVRKVTQVDGVATASCAAASKSKSYDPNGFLVSRTDWEGNITTYVRNSKGQETSRTEAVGTTQERTITTEWHATFSLPTKITDSVQETIFTYDVSTGVLLSKTVTATQP